MAELTAKQRAAIERLMSQIEAVDRRCYRDFRVEPHALGGYDDSGGIDVATARAALRALLSPNADAGAEPSSGDLREIGRGTLVKLVESMRKDYAALQAECGRLKEANGTWVRAAELHQDMLRHANNYGAEQRAFRGDAEADAERAWKRVKLLERQAEDACASLLGRKPR